MFRLLDAKLGILQLWFKDSVSKRLDKECDNMRLPDASSGIPTWASSVIQVENLGRVNGLVGFG